MATKRKGKTAGHKKAVAQSASAFNAWSSEQDAGVRRANELLRDFIDGYITPLGVAQTIRCRVARGETVPQALVEAALIVMGVENDRLHLRVAMAETPPAPLAPNPGPNSVGRQMAEPHQAEDLAVALLTKAREATR